jgi:hypothetical protein
MENQSELADLEARTRRLSVYNGEKPVLGKKDLPATGFQDEIEPAGQSVESMADADKVSHQDDAVEKDGNDAVSVSPSMTSTTVDGVGKKKKKGKSKSKMKRGIVSSLQPPVHPQPNSLPLPGQAHRLRRILHRRPHHPRTTRPRP